MKKLSSLAALCAALCFVSVCVGLITAPPALAQAGTGKDVRVVNTTAEAVPVRAPSPLPVNVNSLPAVQVSSLPAVQVSSLPAVQIDGSTPVTVRGPATQTILDQSGSVPPGTNRVFSIPVENFDKVRFMWTISTQPGASPAYVNVVSASFRIFESPFGSSHGSEVFDVPGILLQVVILNDLPGSDVANFGVRAEAR